MESKHKIMPNDATGTSPPAGKHGLSMASVMALSLTQQDDPVTHQFPLLSGALARWRVLSGDPIALSYLIQQPYEMKAIKNPHLMMLGTEIQKVDITFSKLQI